MIGAVLTDRQLRSAVHVDTAHFSALAASMRTYTTPTAHHCVKAYLLQYLCRDLQLEEL